MVCVEVYNRETYSSGCAKSGDVTTIFYNVKTECNVFTVMIHKTILFL